MSYDPYLDTDWTQATLEISHVLWLSDEEIKRNNNNLSDRAKKPLKTTNKQLPRIAA